MPVWQKERGGGGLIYRTATWFGRVWQSGRDERWGAVRRPEPYIAKRPGWAGPETFADQVTAQAWVEAGGEKRKAKK